MPDSENIRALARMHMLLKATILEARYLKEIYGIEFGPDHIERLAVSAFIHLSQRNVAPSRISIQEVKEILGIIADDQDPAEEPRNILPIRRGVANADTSA